MRTPELPISFTLNYEGSTLVFVRNGDHYKLESAQSSDKSPGPEDTKTPPPTEITRELQQNEFVAYHVLVAGQTAKARHYGYIKVKVTPDTYTVLPAHKISNSGKLVTIEVKTSDIEIVPSVLKSTDLKVGEKVQIARAVYRDAEGNSYGWDSAMDSLIGTEGVVTYVRTTAQKMVRVQTHTGDYWYFGAESLARTGESVKMPPKGALVETRYVSLDGEREWHIVGEVIENTVDNFKLKGWRVVDGSFDKAATAAATYRTAVSWNGNPANFKVVTPFDHNFRMGDIVLLVRPWDIGDVSFSEGVRSAVGGFAHVSTLYSSRAELGRTVADAPVYVRMIDKSPGSGFYLSPFALRRATKAEIKTIFTPGKLVVLEARPEHVTKQHWTKTMDRYVGQVGRVLEYDMVGTGPVSADYPLKVEVFRNDGSRDTLWWPIEAVRMARYDRASYEPEKPVEAAKPAEKAEKTPEKVEEPVVSKPERRLVLCEADQKWHGDSVELGGSTTEPWEWQVGDRAIVSQKVAAVNGEDMQWTPEMDATVGQVGTLIASEDSDVFGGAKRYLVALDSGEKRWYAGAALCSVFERARFAKGTKVRAVRRDRYWEARSMDKMLQDDFVLTVDNVSPPIVSSVDDKYVTVNAHADDGSRWQFGPLTLHIK